MALSRRCRGGSFSFCLSWRGVVLGPVAQRVPATSSGCRDRSGQGVQPGLVDDRRARFDRRAGVAAGAARRRRRARAADRRQRRRRPAGDRASRRPARCIGRGRPRSSGAGRDRCGCSRRQRRRRPAAQLGSRRFKTDDRDCAALVWLLRQGAGAGRAPTTVEALLGAVRHRRQLVDARRVAQQRLHDQLNALCPGLSAPAGHGRALKLESPTGQAVLACAVAFAGRPPTPRSLLARAPGPA